MAKNMDEMAVEVTRWFSGNWGCKSQTSCEYHLRGRFEVPSTLAIQGTYDNNPKP